MYRIAVYVILIVKVIQSSAYLLNFSENSLSNGTVSNSSTIDWVGWNTTPAVQTDEDSRNNIRSSDWTWNTETESKALEKTINFQVLDDDSNGDIRKPNWPHDDSVYDPYSYQNQQNNNHHTQHQYGHLYNELHHSHQLPSRHYHTHLHDNKLHVHNSLHPYPPRGEEYVWKDLKPLDHHHAHPPPTGWHGDFGSGVSSSSAILTTASASASASSGGGDTTVTETNRKHGGNYYYHPYPKDYNRKRYRLEIHPGFIAAPIAGLAAFGVAHAFTSKPVLLELGLVDKKKQHAHIPHHYPHGVHPIPISPSKPEPYPEFPPHVHPHPSFPHHHPHHPLYPISPQPETIDHTHYPILKPVDKPNPENQQESKPWWSPFAAMIPRLRRNEAERD